MKMPTKAILGTLAALVVGGLGNGVWEYVLEPSFQGGASLALNIATLGVEAFKDDIYVEIAKGFHEKQSVSTANFVAILWAYGFATALFLLTRKSRRLVEKVDRDSKEIEELEVVIDTGEPQPQTPISAEARLESLRSRLAVAKVRNAALKTRVRWLHRFAVWTFALSVALVAWAIVGSAKSRYINSGIAHFEQSMAIVTPHARPAEVLLLRSRFARINNRDDFVTLLSEIDRIGDRGGIELPAFETW